MGDEYPNPERRATLEALAEQIRSVDDARRILAEQRLHRTRGQEQTQGCGGSGHDR